MPPGLRRVSIGGHDYVADRFGVIEVPEGVGVALIARGEGFAETTERPPPGTLPPPGPPEE